LGGDLKKTLLIERKALFVKEGFEFIDTSMNISNDNIFTVGGK